MKTPLSIIIILLLTSCKTQSQVSSLFQGHLDYGQTTNAYHKDVDNDFNVYEGQWQYAANDTIIDVTLEKVEYISNTFPITNTLFYEDLLIGALRLTIGGNILVDTYPELNDSNIQGKSYSVSGNLIFGSNGKPACTDCFPNERRIKIHLRDPNKPYIPMAMLLRYRNNTNQDKLLIRFMGNGTWVDSDSENPVESTFPYGVYEFTRQ